MDDCINLIEWLKIHKLSDLKRSHTKLMRYASLYLQSWNKQTNTQSDHCLLTAYELATEFFRRNREWNVVNDWLLYFKILLFLGYYPRAIDVITHILKKTENDYDYPNYLFYAGVVHKAYQDFEKANVYFFDATKLGPPKFFSDIEMMTIISRNLEDMEDDDTNKDTAYQMVLFSYFQSVIVHVKNVSVGVFPLAS